MRSVLFGIALVLSGLAQPALAEVDVTDCDALAAHPSDPDHVGRGLSSSEVVTHRAIPACRAAVDTWPDEPRFHYQLGRAIVYWADANNGDYSEGMEHLHIAADMGYTQALFVVGLMHLREGRICAAEPVTRRAADQGLKAARISYVDHVLAGRFDACTEQAGTAQLGEWLDAASSQVNGYYENMLIGSLRRQLDARDER